MTNQDTSWWALLDRRLLPKVLMVSLAVWLHAADDLLVTTMMPAIIGDIGGAEYVAWSLSLYQIGSVVAGATSALVAARFGFRLSMIFAAFIYMGGCILSATAPDMGVLLVGRAAQGIGGGGLVALAFVATTTLFPRALMPRVMAAMSAFWGASAFLGPMIGGVFSEAGWWRGGFWFFAVQAGGLILAILTGISDDKPREPARAARPPILRLAMLVAGVTSIASAGINISLIKTPSLIGLGLGFLLLFLWRDQQAGATRMLPMNPISFSNPVSAGLTMMVCFAIATVPISAYGPVLIVTIYEVPALIAGYLVAGATIGWTIAALLFSGLPEKYDCHAIAAGVGLVTLSICGFIVSVPQGPIWLIGVFTLMEGAGFGLAWPYIMRRLITTAPDDETERVSTALPTLQRLGYATGAAYTGIVANAIGFADVIPIQTAKDVAFSIFVAGMVFAGIGLIAAWGFLRRTDGGESPENNTKEKP